MDTRELLIEIAQIVRQMAYEATSKDQFYLHKLADTIENAIEESEV